MDDMEAATTDTLKIAVTGGAGSGKTAVCNRLKELGLKVISSDMLAREVVAPGAPAYQKIVQYFGEKILLADGHLNRQKLRQIIINDDAARAVLEHYMHPEINKLVQLRTFQAWQDGERLVFIEIPLLFELGIQDQFDVVVMISAERELRIQRLMKRDGVLRNGAEDLIDVQLPDDEKERQADFVIKNNGTVEQLRRAIDLFFQEFGEKYGKTIKSA
jgi:dephospho-CoA kinase